MGAMAGSHEMTTYQNVKPVTLSPGDCLAVIQRALVDLNASGVNVRVSPMFGLNSEKMIAIILEGVEIDDGNLRIVKGK